MTAAAAASTALPAKPQEFPGLRPLDISALPVTKTWKIALSADNPADWAHAIGRMAENAGGGGPLLQSLAWGLETGALLRWACLAARLEEILSGRARSEALIIAERWLREQKEPLRYEAYRLAEAEDFATPATMAAVAAYASGPSLAPADAPPSPPSPGLGRSTATGVLVSVASAEALENGGFARVNMIGLDLARGGDGRRGAHDALAETKR